MTPPIRRLFHVSKRVDRLEMITPVQLRATLALLRAVKAGKANGETDAAIKEVDDMLTNGVISQKAGT